MKVAKLLIGEDGIKSFTIDGISQVCPFQTPFIIPSRIQGQPPIIQRQTCNNTCPHCDIQDLGFILTCGNTVVRMPFEKKEDK